MTFGLFQHWRSTLERVDQFFDRRRGVRLRFAVLSFVVFFAINLICFWSALWVTYPEYLVSPKSLEYQLMCVPVAFLGASFDLASLFVTLALVKKALGAQKNSIYLALLSVDVLIAILAGLWVLFAFIVSGWMVSFVLETPETMSSRTQLYEGRMWSIFESPLSDQNIRNVFFGAVMGGTALLPTLVHIGLAMGALINSIGGAFQNAEQRVGGFRILFVAALLVVAAGSLFPSPPAGLPEGSDKLQHLFAYLVLGWLGRHAFSRSELIIMIFLVSFGTSIEIIQSYIPGRDMSLLDMASNTVGVLSAAVIYRVWNFQH
jgi:hypothetical protein